MISINTERARTFIPDSTYKKQLEAARNSLQQISTKTVRGSEWLGWNAIPEEPDYAEIDKIVSHAERIRAHADIFIVCGIGGSYTGSMAVIQALNPIFKKRGPEIIFAGHHMGSRYLDELLEYLAEPREDGSPKSVYLNVISKSGSTLETAVAFRTIRNWMHEVYDDARARITATTGPKGGVLNEVVRKEGYQKYIIPDDVGGRFSVLTPAGLLPIAVAGVDIRALLEGAVSEFNLSGKDPGRILEYAAIRAYFHDHGYDIDVLSSFEPELSGFLAWTQQLLGESEGKDRKGLFPANARFTTDLHSIGQLIQDGRRNLIETIIEVDTPQSEMKVPEKEELDEDGLSYVAGKSIHEINKNALEGTASAHHEGGVPVIRIILDRLTAGTLGELIYFYELFTAVYVNMLGVNPFDQPGVENYKKAMYKLLGR